MNTYVHLLQYLAEFFLERDMSYTILVEKFKACILYSIFIFKKNRAVLEIM
jgi:hypothetical protein